MLALSIYRENNKERENNNECKQREQSVNLVSALTCRITELVPCLPFIASSVSNGVRTRTISERAALKKERKERVENENGKKEAEKEKEK
jgi:hypothetical protein